jgi:hypothetical protein
VEVEHESTSFGVACLNRRGCGALVCSHRRAARSKRKATERRSSAHLSVERVAAGPDAALRRPSAARFPNYAVVPFADGSNVTDG